MCTRILKSDLRVKVKPSTREQEIQEARKVWVDARDKAQEALLIYKEAKGDFYK